LADEAKHEVFIPDLTTENYDPFWRAVEEFAKTHEWPVIRFERGGATICLPRDEAVLFRLEFG
jgi:hypothetical protein